MPLRKAYKYLSWEGNVNPLQRLHLASAVKMAVFAKQHHFDPSHYRKIVVGKIKPDPTTARRIATAWGGAITEQQILYPEDSLVPAPRLCEAAKVG